MTFNDAHAMTHAATEEIVKGLMAFGSMISARTEALHSSASINPGHQNSSAKLSDDTPPLSLKGQGLPYDALRGALALQPLNPIRLISCSSCRTLKADVVQSVKSWP